MNKPVKIKVRNKRNLKKSILFCLPMTEEEILKTFEEMGIIVHCGLDILEDKNRENCWFFEVEDSYILNVGYPVNENDNISEWNYLAEYLASCAPSEQEIIRQRLINEDIAVEDIIYHRH